MTDTGIELQSVSKIYGNITALQDFDLKIQSGELTALLGPNGAGKTTTILLILGLIRPTQGNVKVLGKNPKHIEVRENLGVMPQESAIPQALTVKETISLFASFYSAPTTIENALALADLSSLANRRAGQLSGGQKRRLAFALAIVGNPEVLLIDEPTTGMDAGSRVAFWNAMEKLKIEGRTILLTTHYLEEAERMADRVIIMNCGKILADGTPIDLRAQTGHTKVRFRSDMTSEEVKTLAGLYYLETHRNGYFEILTNTPEDLLTSMIHKKMAFNELEVIRSSLEDTFLNLTNNTTI